MPSSIRATPPSSQANEPAQNAGCCRGGCQCQCHLSLARLGTWLRGTKHTRSPVFSSIGPADEGEITIGSVRSRWGITSRTAVEQGRPIYSWDQVNLSSAPESRSASDLADAGDDFRNIVVKSRDRRCFSRRILWLAHACGKADLGRKRIATAMYDFNEPPNLAHALQPGFRV